MCKALCYALRTDIEVEHSSVPANTFAPVYWGTDDMVYIFKQPWRASERDELPFISSFYRTEAIFDDVEGLMVTWFEHKRDAFELVTRERTHTHRDRISYRTPMSSCVSRSAPLLVRDHR